MGELIRFVSYEVGHTLGLRHNMGASSQLLLKIERGVSRKNGHFFYHGLCTIMFTQPEDG
jgi:hypothetical protein